MLPCREGGRVGAARQRAGDLAGAKAALDEAVRIFENAYDPWYFELAATMHSLADVEGARGDDAAAQALTARADAIWRRANE